MHAYVEENKILMVISTSKQKNMTNWQSSTYSGLWGKSYGNMKQIFKNWDNTLYFIITNSLITLI